MILSRAKTGSLADRILFIPTLACLQEIEGFREGAAKYNNPLTPQEQQALTIREAELAKAGMRK